MTKYLSIAILITGFLVGNAYGKDLIADVYFDDGSVLNNTKLEKSAKIKVKYENEFFTLNFKDLKTLEFNVEPGNSQIEDCVPQAFTDSSCNDVGKEAIVTLKVKTKTGIVINNRFSTADGRAISGVNYKNELCQGHGFSFKNKLTGRETTKFYSITNLRHTMIYCVFTKHETKAIKSIVFKE
jgi:hypothetical protein